MTCRNCQQQLTVEEQKEMISQQLALESTLATKEVIQKRREICYHCPFLIAAICTKCGCYAEFRLHLPQKDCPMKKWNRSISHE